MWQALVLVYHIPLYPSNTESIMGRAVKLYTSSCLLSRPNTVSKVNVFGGSWGVSCLLTVMVPRISSTVTDCLCPIIFSFWLRGRHRTTTFTLSLTSNFSGLSSLLLYEKTQQRWLKEQVTCMTKSLVIWFNSHLTVKVPRKRSTLLDVLT